MTNGQSTKKKPIRARRTLADSTDSPTASTATTESVGPFFYVTQERAFAPGIASGWPKVIEAPHSPHGRLVRRDGDGDVMRAALEAINTMACYTQEDASAENREAMLQSIGATARAALGRADT